MWNKRPFLQQLQDLIAKDQDEWNKLQDERLERARSRFISNKIKSLSDDFQERCSRLNKARLKTTEIKKGEK